VEQLERRTQVQQVGDEVECEVYIAASPEIVYAHFVDPARAVRWMGISAQLEPRPGGLYRVDVTGEYIARGEYVELIPNRRVVFTWGWERGQAAVPPGSSTVEVSLSPDGDGTRLRLRHLGLPEAARAAHAQGWEHYLSRLAAAATGGDPGPDPMLSSRPTTDAG